MFTLQSSWGLQKRPKTGFYINLIDFHQKYYSHVSQRDVGRAILSMDPWMQECVDKKFPLNAYRKILRLKKKKVDTDAELPYSTGKIYSSICTCAYKHVDLTTTIAYMQIKISMSFQHTGNSTSRTPLTAVSYGSCEPARPLAVTLTLPGPLTQGSGALRLPGPLTQGSGAQRLPGPLPQGSGSDRLPGPLPQGSGSDRLPGPLTQGSGSDRLPGPLTQGSGSDRLPGPLTQGSGSDRLPGPLTQASGALRLPGPLTQGSGALRLPGPLTQASGALRLPGPLTQGSGALRLPGPLTQGSGALRLPGPLTQGSGALRLPGPLTQASGALRLPRPLPQGSGALTFPRPLTQGLGSHSLSGPLTPESQNSNSNSTPGLHSTSSNRYSPHNVRRRELRSKRKIETLAKQCSTLKKRIKELEQDKKHIIKSQTRLRTQVATLTRRLHQKEETNKRNLRRLHNLCARNAKNKMKQRRYDSAKCKQLGESLSFVQSKYIG